MGGHEGWAQPNGFFPNGLLPNEAASVTRVLDPERWSIAEQRTEELITCIQPNHPSEERRNAVACYVQRLMMRCFSCQVFTFGSVPLKTYLPDGDIDLTAFSRNQNLKDTWANEVKDMLESEEKNEDAEFRVKEVQYIQAEVKIIKCLVENIVVDISFNQLGGLCTLCFLEEVDHLINQNHLFKRSIILIKAWCYYESRILGAHHGLISTYALETLVLYIFHVFNKPFAGPLEVLYRFLEFFSKFDWDNFCVGLLGPVPISALPDMTADPPRKDGGELLLSKTFLDACSSVYAVFPGGQENQEQPFISKHFNVIDPLRTNNNLGRSVSKGNFYRIRSAFAFGAQRLARLLDCPKENLNAEVNQFFMNTWDRHGKGLRPDAPNPDLYVVQPHTDARDAIGNFSHNKKVKENVASEAMLTRITNSSHDLKGVSKTSNVSAVSRTQSQKTSANLTNSVASDQNNHNAQNISSNESGKYQFARTHSSPELTDTSIEVGYRGRHTSNKASETGKAQIALSRSDYSRRRNLGFEISDINNNNSSPRFSNEVPPSSRQSSSHSNSASNSYHGDSVAETMQMHQDEQDLVNMMAASSVHGFSGQVQMPVNLASPHLPLPMSPSVLTSFGGYGHRNAPGIIPSFESSWGSSNMHFPQGLVPLPMSQYLPNIGVGSNREETLDPIEDNNLGSTEINQEDIDHGYWPERDAEDSVSRFRHPDNGIYSTKGILKESRGLIRENYSDSAQYQINRGSVVDGYSSSSSSSRLSPTSQPASSKVSSKSTKDNKRGRKPAVATDSPPNVDSGLIKNGWNFEAESVDCGSSQVDDDNRDWIPLSTTGAEVADRTIPAQISGSNSMLPVGPVIVGPPSKPGGVDNSGGILPFTFYATGPPVPFVTMLPFYNFPPETGSSGGSPSHFDREEELNNNYQLTNLESSNEVDTSKALNRFNISSEEYKSDILNSDFPSHWQNLQYGRSCQNSRYPGPMIYPSSVVPMYLQGHFPWDGPGRPIPTTNVNHLFSQLMSYSPRFVPVSPLQPASNRPAGAYQHYGDEIPRYRGGTGTYLPNPKMSYRDRQSSNSRNHRGNYSFDRKDHHGDREGNWNNNSKQRFQGRNQGRNQFEKPNTRVERSTSNNNRTERSWDLPFKQDSFPSSYHSHNRGSANVAYGMYPVPSVNPNASANGVLPPGTGSVPSVVMLYHPYDQNMGYGEQQLEFGSLGPMHFSGMNEMLTAGEGSSRGVNEPRNLRRSSAHSSPDQPSSPNPQRSTVQKNYQFKE